MTPADLLATAFADEPGMTWVCGSRKAAWFAATLQLPALTIHTAPGAVAIISAPPPAGRTKPAGPAQPIPSAGPAQPAGSAEPAGPAGLAQPAGSAEPAGPAGLAQPAGVAEPAGPARPGGPAGEVGQAGGSPGVGALVGWTWRVLCGCGPRAVSRTLAYQRATDRLKPAGVSTVEFVGVLPDSRGKGAARRLIDGVPGPLFLTTADPANVALYQHLGFQVTHRARVGPLMVAAMLRR
ncbi:hypothetical protein [Actinokineospora sp. HUAS TT18]|uniref:hypothetical protein n=1 Tax=Actinokineospora sp. HUAS TT18 TaxID=3447451 RepID=UPI003F522C33